MLEYDCDLLPNFNLIMNNNNSQFPSQFGEYPRNDEIDLAELIRSIWKKKSWIVTGAILGGILSGAYAFTAKEQWTSTAEVIAPKIADLAPYYTIRAEYERIFNGTVDVAELGSQLYTKFDSMLHNLDDRERFFLQSDVYKTLSEGKSEEEKRKILSELVRNNTKITKPDPKKSPDLIGKQVSFSAEKPDVAHNTLKSYFENLSKRAYDEDFSEFNFFVSNKLLALKSEKEKIETELNIKKSVKLDNLRKNLSIAENAGIKEFSNGTTTTTTTGEGKVSIEDSELGEGSYLFMLGEKYLKAQISAAEKEAIIYPPKYYEINEQLKKLEQFLPKLEDYRVSSYSYIASPSYPVTKDKPKRAIILLLGLIVGGFLGTCAVLMNNLLRKEKN